MFDVEVFRDVGQTPVSNCGDGAQQPFVNHAAEVAESQIAAEATGDDRGGARLASLAAARDPVHDLIRSKAPQSDLA